MQSRKKERKKIKKKKKLISIQWFILTHFYCWFGNKKIPHRIRHPCRSGWRKRTLVKCFSIEKENHIWTIAARTLSLKKCYNIQFIEYMWSIPVYLSFNYTFSLNHLHNLCFIDLCAQHQSCTWIRKIPVKYHV